MGAEVRSWLYKTPSIHRERGCGWIETPDSMDSTETQSGWSIPSAREEIAATRLLGGESVEVILEKSGRVSNTELA